MKFYKTEKALLNGIKEYKIFIQSGGRQCGRQFQLDLIEEVFALKHEVRSLNKGLPRKDVQIRKWKSIAYDYYEKCNNVKLGAEVKFL